ncbi:MAG: hypothetical protein AAFY46_05215, partial [Planctomycetota bacterium]
AFVLLAGCFGVAHVYLEKFGKLRNQLVGAVSGVLLAGVFTAGTFVAIWQIDGGSSGFGAFHDDRLRAGVVPIPPLGWTLGGWLLGAVWVFGALGVGLVGLITGGVTPGQPFCEECTSWGNRLLWRGTIARPDPDWLKRASRSGSPKEVMAAVSGSGKGVAFIDVRGCRCKSMVSLEVREAEDANDKMPGVAGEAIPLSSADLQRLAAWAKERGMPGEVPQLETGLADPVVTLTSTTGPADGEYESRHRTNGNFMTLSLVHDNEYTHELRAWLEYEGFELARSELARWSHPSDRAFVAEAIADGKTPPPWIEEWQQADEDSPELSLLLGIRAVKDAWDARGAGWTPQNTDAFAHLLNAAESLLFRAAHRLSRDPTPWVWLLYSGKGLQVGREELVSRYSEMTARSPRHVLGHSFMVDALSTKWGGADADALKLARSASQAARDGSQVHVAVAEAWAEVMGTQLREKQVRSEAEWWRQNQAALSEIKSLNDRVFASKKFRPNMETPRVRSVFASLLRGAGEMELAAAHAPYLRGNAGWPYFGSFPAIPGPNSLGRFRRQAKRYASS